MLADRHRHNGSRRRHWAVGTAPVIEGRRTTRGGARCRTAPGMSESQRQLRRVVVGGGALRLGIVRRRRSRRLCAAAAAHVSPPAAPHPRSGGRRAGFDRIRADGE